MTGQKGVFDGAAEVAPAAETPALFEAESVPVVPSRGGLRPGAGRPKGALNRSNRELREYLVHKTGRDAIEEAYALAARPVMTSDEELQKLAKHLGCSRLEAAEFWAKVSANLYPYIYPRLGQLTLKAPGAPEIEFGFGWPADLDGDVVEVTDVPPDESDAA